MEIISIGLGAIMAVFLALIVYSTRNRWGAGGWGWRWRHVAALFAFTTALGAVLLFFGEDLGSPAEETGLVILSASFGFVLAYALARFEGWTPILVPALLVLGVCLIIADLVFDGENGLEPVETGQPKAGEATPLLAEVSLEQFGETHIVSAEDLEGEVQDLVLEPGEATLTALFEDPQGRPLAGQVVALTDLVTGAETQQTLSEDGKASFKVILTVPEGQTWSANPYRLVNGTEKREFSLFVVNQFPGGQVASDAVNTASELTGQQTNQPYTVGLEVDQTLVAAFGKFCGFSVSEIKAVRLVPNDKPRFQVMLVAGEFVQAPSQIPVGQPVWAVISQDPSKEPCFINPPCGNPEKPPEVELPPAPPITTPVPTPTPVKPTPTPVPPGETPRPTLTPRPTPTPRLTPTPPEKTVTPTPKKSPTPTPTPTKVKTPTPSPTPKTPTPTPPRTPTPTPRTPTPSPTPTLPPTPTQPPQLIFGCPDFLEHGSRDFTRIGVAISNQPVRWRVEIDGVVVAETNHLSTSISIEAPEGSHVVVWAMPSWSSSWTLACSRVVDVSEPGETPEPSRTPAPTLPPPTTPVPTPATTPPPP